MRNYWISFLVCITGLSWANAAEYHVEVEPSPFYQIEVKLNERPIQLNGQNGVSGIELQQALNVEENSLEICYKHLKRGNKKPNLKQLSGVALNRKEGTLITPIGRVFAPHAGEFEPGHITCREISFNAASFDDQSRIEQYRRLEKIKSQLPKGFLQVNQE